MTQIVKQHKKKGHEVYSRQKLANSIIAACNAVYSTKGSAELAANRVCDEVETWLSVKPEVTSADIRRVAAKSLRKYNPDAAYYYSQHKHII